MLLHQRIMYGSMMEQKTNVLKKLNVAPMKVKQMDLLKWLVNNVFKTVKMSNISKKVVLKLIRIHVLNLVVNQLKELMLSHMFGTLMLIIFVQFKCNVHQKAIHTKILVDLKQTNNA